MNLKFMVFLLLVSFSAGCLPANFVGGGRAGENLVQDEVHVSASELAYLELSTISTDVEVRVAEVDDVVVRLDGRIRINYGEPNATLKLAVIQQGSKVFVEPKLTANVDSYSGYLKLLVLVPEGVYPEISIETSSGSADIRNYDGNIRFDSSSGNFNYRQQREFRQNVHAKTRSGSLNAWISRNSSYCATGKTVMGTARASGITSHDRRSFSGQVGIGRPLGIINLETSSGSVYVRDL